MKRKLGMVLALAALMILPLLPRLVRAQTGHGGAIDKCSMMGPGPMMHPGGMVGGMPLPVFLRAADLTPAQQAKVQKILDDNRANLHSQFAEMRAARKQMAVRLFSTGPLTATDLSAQSSQIAQAQQQMLQSELNVALQVRGILTPAQLQKVAQFHQKFESLHQQMRKLLGPGGRQLDGPGPDDQPPV